MFERLLHISQILYGDENDRIKLLNEGLEPSYHYGLAVCFDEMGQYKDIVITEGSKNVIYIKGAPNGFDPLAVSKFAGSPQKVTQRLEKCLQAFSQSSQSAPIQDEMDRIMDGYNGTQISEDIGNELEKLDTREKYPFVYLSWLEGTKPVPFYENKHFKQFAISEVLSRYGRVKRQPLEVENQVCSVCGKLADKVYGNFSLISCYNLDKRGLITGGMDHSAATQNFPVCDYCMLAVSKGWNFVNSNLQFNLAGEPYLLLPQIHSPDPELRNYVIEELKKRERGISLKKEALKTITNFENEILEALADISGDKDEIILSVIFFQKKNAAWRITAEVPTILPSRIQEIYRIKNQIDSDPLLVFGKNQTYGFTLKTLRQFTGTRTDKSSQKQFLTYVDQIFAGRTSKIAREVFFRDAVSVILTSYKREPDTAIFTVRDAWATYLFLSRLDILTPPKGGVTMAESDNVYGKFLAIHDEFFDCQEKAVAFLTGCYVSAVTSAQYQNLDKRTPFLKKVQGVKMDRRKLKQIYPEAQTKLRQYDSFRWIARTLDPQLAEAWIKCGEKWNISDEESTFAFTLGMSLADKIRQTDENAVLTEDEEGDM